MILAETDEYLIEYEIRILSIARFSDGKALCFQGPKIREQWEDAVTKFGLERTIATHIRMGRGHWLQLYTPEKMRRSS